MCVCAVCSDDDDDTLNKKIEAIYFRMPEEK